MNCSTKRFINIFLCIVAFAGIASCTSDKPFDGGISSVANSYSGYIVVTTVDTDPATGPGIVTFFKPDGTFYSTLRDLFPSIEWAMGSSFVAPNKILVGIANGTRIEELNLTTNINVNFTTARINGSPNRALIQDTVDGSIYLAEQNVATSTIEKYDLTGNPIGAPFIPSTVSSCVLNNPTSLAFIPSSQNIAAVQSTRLNIYDSSGSCVTSVTAAPFNANTPFAVAYHATTNKLLVALAGTSSIQACSISGTACSQIYLNPSIISIPRSITTDSNGYIYVGSAGTDTVEKLIWSGSGLATRATTGSFIGPGIYSQNPTSIMVIP